MEEFYFIAITEVNGLNDGLQGILGMGPLKGYAPSFIESLMTSEIITRAITSFSLGNNSPEINQKSHVVFGGINYK